MLVPIRNAPRDYAWGSRTLLAALEGRAPSGLPEAEVWFGDHPADPAVVPDGRSLADWLAAEGVTAGAPERLPYLLKLLAAASPLSIQVHPSKAQAEVGFAAEEAAGVPRDAAERIFRDDNHKPELIVALSDRFTALVGLRELDETRRLVASLGAPAAELAGRLEPREGGSGASAASVLGAVIAWLLSGAAQNAVDAIIAAVETADAPEFAAEFEAMRQIAARHPGDPGVVVALLMNLVTLRRGEAVFLPAGLLHAYLDGLGVEIMAASDNVLRGGLTPKHIDVPGLIEVLDPRPGGASRLAPVAVARGVERFDPGIPDFALLHVRRQGPGPTELALPGIAIALATAGAPTVRGARSGESAALSPGRAVVVSPDEGAVELSGDGEVFVAIPGARHAVGAS